MYDLLLVGFLGRLELLGNFLPHPSASTLTSSIVVSSQISTSFPCSVEFYLLVYNPSRSYLTPECEFHLNQARSLSYLYVSPNKTCRSTNSRFPTFNLSQIRACFCVFSGYPGIRTADHAHRLRNLRNAAVRNQVRCCRFFLLPFLAVP